VFLHVCVCPSPWSCCGEKHLGFRTALSACVDQIEKVDTCRFDGLESYKLQYSRPEWLGKGDSCCRVEIRTITTS
jgi:hypothetical protein